ncbi:MAG TPA: glycosyltransferase family 4 protein [Cyclobacteriaceae bacterium]|nr:glycosyltransferase family 4 protein [Cyclobacteriaceae bacterium]
MKRLKVLVSAYACSPYKGSEPGVGWGFVSELSKYHDLWVIVEEEKFRTDIEKFLKINPNQLGSVRFFFIHKQRNRWLRKLWPPSYYRYYRRWHQDAYRLAVQLHQEIGFDLAHQLTMVGFREPGYLWKLDIPFVWGPIGGMGLFPWRFVPIVGSMGAFYYLGYNLFNSIHMRFLRRPRLAAMVAGSGLIAMNKENQIGIYQYYGMPSEVCIPVGPPDVVVDTIVKRVISEPLRIVWSGLHIHRKALNLALYALSSLPLDIKWEFHILGDGILKKKWQQYAYKMGISQRCIFYGQVSRDVVLEVMKLAHVHLMTSLREGTPTVIVEGFSFGLPTVCLDCSGMSDMVDNSCGIKIPVTTPSDVINAIARAIEQLARNEEKRQVLAHGALQRVRDFAWEEKARVIDRIYRAKAGNVTISTTSEA